MKNGISLLVLALFCNITFAQNNLEGTILNAQDQSPVIGASITINNTFSNTISDATGHFSFKGIVSGNYEISISHLSFETKSVSVSTGTENKISLQPKIYLADEITISATRVDQKNGTAFNNISKEDLEKNNFGQDLPILLSSLPSVVVTSDAGNGVGYTGIRVRGNDPTRVNVTINGVPVNDAESHQVYWVDLPDIASSTDNIQFQRGLGSSTNGAGAFGASINLQTTKISQLPYGNVSTSFGSFRTNKNTVAFGTGILNNHFTIDGRLSMINSDGYIDRASSNLRSLNLSGGYYNDKEFIRAVIISGKEKTYQSWYGISKEVMDTNRTYNPAGEYVDTYGNVRYYDNQTDNYQQDYYQMFYSRTINKKLTGNIALHYTKGKGYYEEFQPLDNIGDYGLAGISIGDTTIDQTPIVRRKWLSNDFYGTTFSLDYESGALNLKFGGGANNYVGRHYNEIISAGIFPGTTFPFRYYDDEAKKTDINIFIKATYALNSKISLTGDLQERSVDYNFTKLSTDNSGQAKLNFFNPKVGFNYRVSSNQQIHFYAGMGHKEPVRDDYLVSTPTTRPNSEEMIDYELGYNYSSKKVGISINGYFMDYQNQLILTGKINEVGEYIRENVKNSSRKGIEAEIKYQFSKSISLNGNLTLSENKIKSYTEYVDDYDGGEQHINTYTNSTISFSPSVISAAEINFTPVKNFRFSINSKYVGKQYLDNTTNENSVLDSYFLLNAGSNFLIPIKGIRSLEIKLQVNNLLNEKYSANGYSYSGYSSGNRDSYNFYFPQAGINWMGGIVIGF